MAVLRDLIERLQRAAETRVEYGGAEALVGAATEVIDLAGHMALPGLHDVHIHPVLSLERMTCALALAEYRLRTLQHRKTF